MKNRYYHLLSPVQIGAVTLKNRMLSSSSVLHFLQGPENYPTDAMIANLAKRAKSGAAMVTCRGIYPRVGRKRVASGKDIPHMFDLDLYDPKCQNYISSLTEALHFYDTKACMNLGCRQFDGYDVSAGLVQGGMGKAESVRPGCPGTSQELTEDMLAQIIDSYVEQAVILKSLGFDACSLHMCYRFQMPGRFLSPLTNHRSDQYGGDIDHRARFPLDICRAIKEACGQDFIIEALVSAEEYEPGGMTIDETIRFAKLAEGCIDILQLRAGEGDISHPTGFERKPEPFIQYAQAVKESGTRVFVETIGGYQNPDIMEDVIASGKADLIGMARSWISNVDYGQKIYDGRTDDIRPCIRCNKCHVASLEGPWNSVCSVNPVIGLEDKLSWMVTAPSGDKKIAVIGGGPGGMQAAITAADRGYSVTLYEQSSALGGQLKHTDRVDFKWPVRDYKDFLIRQTNKRQNIRVLLNTKASPELLENAGYDAVLACVGAAPILPGIEGLQREKSCFASEIIGSDCDLGARVVIIGGGEIGMETAIWLAESGTEVTVLEMKPELAETAPPLHYRSMFEAEWKKYPNLRTVTEAVCTRVGDGFVEYRDKDGKIHTVASDSVVVAAGMTPLTKDALAFYGCAPRFSLVGDCSKVGNIQTTTRSAFAAASVL